MHKHSGYRQVFKEIVSVLTWTALHTCVVLDSMHHPMLMQGQLWWCKVWAAGGSKEWCAAVWQLRTCYCAVCTTCSAACTQKVHHYCMLWGTGGEIRHQWCWEGWRARPLFWTTCNKRYIITMLSTSAVALLLQWVRYQAKLEGFGLKLLHGVGEAVCQILWPGYYREVKRRDWKH